jgi:hypothetical protein
MVLASLSRSAASVALTVTQSALIVTTAMVVFGVIGAYAPRRKRRLWRRASEILLIVGVAGEMLAESAMFLISGRLESIHEDETMAAHREVERLRSDNLALEQLIQPRSLGREQLTSLLRKALPFAGQAVRVRAEPHDAEAYWLAVQLVTVLNAATWKVSTEFTGTMVSDQESTGIMVVSPHDSRSESAMAMLVDELQRDGLSEVKSRVDTDGGTAPPNTTPELLIAVRSKPLPGIREFIVEEEGR